jgi:predicted ATPase
MIYGVAGASGTGKSTLCQHVSDALSIPFVRTSVTDMARKAGFEAVGRLSILDRIALQDSLLDQFNDLLQKARGPVIFDRTPIDLIGYLGAEIHMHSHLDLAAEQLESVNSYITRCQTLTGTYFDRVFVAGLLPDYESADTRPNYNPAYQRHVHLLITGAAVASEVNLDCVLLTTDSLHDRVEIVCDQITDRMKAIEEARRKKPRLH